MKGANDKVLLALIGAGSRGAQLITGMQKCAPNVEVSHICDVDETRGWGIIDELKKQQGYGPEKVTDMRRVFDEKDVDAVVIATPEHWHALATIWALNAGKDVYVEKNVSLSLAEGEKMINTANRTKRLIQCGTQNRSADYAVSAKEFIASGGLGKIVTVKAYCMLPGTRPWVLKEDTSVPEGLDWDMWLGPAAKVPYNVSRHKGWYDWWAYSGGAAMSGDASHVVDLARMVLGDPGHPKAVYCAGGRVIYKDKREIPDNQTVTFDYGTFPMTLEASQYGNYMYKTPPDVRFSDKFPVWKNNATRIEIYGTIGMMYLGRHGSGWQVFGDNMELIAQGTGYFPDEKHQINFITCIRSRNTPNAGIEQGHLSASLINLANLSYRSGKKIVEMDIENEMVINNNEAAQLDNRFYRGEYNFE